MGWEAHTLDAVAVIAVVAVARSGRYVTRATHHASLSALLLSRCLSPAAPLSTPNVVPPQSHPLSSPLPL